MDFDKLCSLSGETQEELHQINAGILALAQIPELFCCMCKQIKEEVIMTQIQYPDHGGQNKVCPECYSKLRNAVTRTLEEVGWPL